MSLRPYELLGVTEKSSINEVRKAYYQLALLCHPDKGGSAEDMRVIQCAYEWITEQLRTVSSPTEEAIAMRKTEFQDFLTAQQDRKIPEWTEVVWKTYAGDIDFDTWYAEMRMTDDDFVKRIVQTLFVSQRMQHMQQISRELSITELRTILENIIRDCSNIGKMPAALEEGYGSYMVASNASVDVTLPDMGKAEMILYKEPIAQFSAPVGQGILTGMERALPDYSNGTGMMDYMKAFQLPDKEGWQKLEAELRPRCESDIQMELEKMELERGLMDLSIQQNKVVVALEEKLAARKK